MHTKTAVCYAIVLVMVAMLAVFPAAAADKSDVVARAATWEKEYNAGNLEAVVALCASDGCRMPPNQETVHGTEAILAELKAGKAQGFAKVKIVVTSAESTGELGYGMGTYEVTGADGLFEMIHGVTRHLRCNVAATKLSSCGEIDLFRVFKDQHANMTDDGSKTF